MKSINQAKPVIISLTWVFALSSMSLASEIEVETDQIRLQTTSSHVEATTEQINLNSRINSPNWRNSHSPNERYLLHRRSHFLQHNLVCQSRTRVVQQQSVQVQLDQTITHQSTSSIYCYRIGD